MMPGSVHAWRPAGRRADGCDLALLFCFAWLATALPLMPHQVPTLWLWGALSGACLMTTSWLLVHRRRRPHAIWSLLGCSALVSIASFVDFWRLSPVYLLSQCRSSADGELFLSLWRHIEFHWQWFPVTTIAMLLWILMPGWRANDQRSLPTQILPRLARGVCMFFCMEIAMRGVEALGIRMQGEMSADGFVCAMLCGMSLYHLLMQVKPFGGSQKWNRKVQTPH
jgi:hypothetical protein